MSSSPYLFSDEQAAAAWHKLTAAASHHPGQLPILKQSHLEAAMEYLGFDADLQAAMLEGISMFSAIPELEPLLNQFNYLLVNRMSIPESQLPAIVPTCHPAAPLFHVYALLSALDAIRSYHRERGVDEAITRDTLSDLLLWLRHFHSLHNRWGFGQFGWLSGHFTGELFKLGRLQFKFETFTYPLRAYRHRQSRKLVVICEPGLQFREDGQFADADGRSAPVAWTATLEENGDAVTATPITPLGKAAREQISLPKAEWERVLGKGDPTLGIHIAATGSMEHAACGESFAMATTFFPRHFPERPFKVFTCTSWLLDPQLAEHLPAASNITRFLKEFYLHPVPKATGNQTFERVFGFGVKPDANLATLPRKSSLQRQIIQHLESGGHWRSGGALFFPEDLAWGTQCYQK